MLIVRGDSRPRGSKIEDTKLNSFLCVYTAASLGNCCRGNMTKLSVVTFHFWQRTLLIAFVSSLSSAEISERTLCVWNKFCQPEAAVFQAVFCLWNGVLGFRYCWQRMDVVIDIKVVPNGIEGCWESNFFIFSAFMKLINRANWWTCSAEG